MIRNLKKNDMVRRASIAIDSSKVAKANQVIEGQRFNRPNKESNKFQRRGETSIARPNKSGKDKGGKFLKTSREKGNGATDRERVLIVSSPDGLSPCSVARTTKLFQKSLPVPTS